MNMSNEGTPSKADNPLKKSMLNTTPPVYCARNVVTIKFIAIQLSNSAYLLPRFGVLSADISSDS